MISLGYTRARLETQIPLELLGLQIDKKIITGHDLVLVLSLTSHFTPYF